MSSINLEAIFAKNYKSLRSTKKLEIALRGGEYHLIEFKDNKIKNSLTKSNYYLSIRGIYIKNYFSFNSRLEDDLFNIIKINQRIKQDKLIKYPFLKPIVYRDNNSLDINYETYNNLLLLDLISKPIFKILKNKFIINGFIYLKKDRLSPFNNQAPIVSIVNNRGLFVKHSQNKIILNLELTNGDNTIKINKIFNTTKEVEEYFNKKIQEIELYLSLPSIKNQILKVNSSNKSQKLILSSTVIAKLLHKFKDNFSVSDYYENENNIFKNQLNKKIFSHKINIQETAYHPLLQAAPFDEIGEEKSIVNIIKNGYLRELTSSYYESLKYKTPLTGHTLLNSKKSKPFLLYLKGSKNNSEAILSNENNIIFINDIEAPREINNLTDTIKIISKNSSIIYQNGKASKLIKNLKLNISIQELFMKVIETTTEKEALGMVTTSIFINL